MQKTKSKLSVVVSCKHHLIRMRVQTSQKTNVRIRVHPIDENKIMQNIAAAGDSRSSSGVSWTNLDRRALFGTGRRRKAMATDRLPAFEKRLLRG